MCVNLIANSASSYLFKIESASENFDAFFSSVAHCFSRDFPARYFSIKIRDKGDTRTKPSKVNIDYRHLPLLSSS